MNGGDGNWADNAAGLIFTYSFKWTECLPGNGTELSPLPPDFPVCSQPMARLKSLYKRGQSAPVSATKNAAEKNKFCSAAVGREIYSV